MTTTRVRFWQRERSLSFEFERFGWSLTYEDDQPVVITASGGKIRDTDGAIDAFLCDGVGTSYGVVEGLNEEPVTLA